MRRFVFGDVRARFLLPFVVMLVVLSGIPERFFTTELFYVGAVIVAIVGVAVTAKGVADIIRGSDHG